MVTYRKNKIRIENAIKDLPLSEQKAEIKEIVKKLRYATKHTEFTATEFFMLDLAHKSYAEWYDYLPDKESWTIYRRLNNTDHSFNSADKYAVFQKYKKYFKREMCLVNSINDKDHFFDLLHQKQSLMLKPQFGSLGDDIIIIKEKNITDKDALFQDILQKYSEGCVAEELIEQDDSLSYLNPTSVNSLRITTVRMDDYTDAQAFLRVGKIFSKVDNIAKGGIVCALDQKTGQITGTMDKLGNSVETHPHTRVKLIGYTVPRLEEAIQLAKEMAEVLPDFRYMGWDIALSKDGWVLVEQNAKAGIYCIQQSLGRGIRKDFEKYFAELGQPIDFPKAFDKYFIRKNISSHKIDLK